VAKFMSNPGKMRLNILRRIMNIFNKSGTDSIRLKWYVAGLVVSWSVVVILSLSWNLDQVKKHFLEVARTQARATYQKDIIYRRWNTRYGGVYAPVNEDTPPNPYLEVPERDITTAAGKTLTLINPAYMTRQVHELEKKASGVRGHITSLTPIRPQNVPDPWETEALKTFLHGVQEVSSVETMEGEPYMRLMRPLVTEQACLQCHAAQGYQVGDIRGGISVSIPMNPLLAIEHSQIVSLLLGHSMLFLLGLGGIALGAYRLHVQMAYRRQAEEALKKSEQQLRKLNASKDKFFSIIAHDLRGPLGSLQALSKFIEEHFESYTPDRLKEIIVIQQKAAENILKLLDNLLTWSKMQRGMLEYHPQRILIEKVVTRNIELFTPVAERKQIILRSSIQEKGSAYADYNMVDTVIRNLIANALKFTHPGGTVEVSVRQKENYFEVAVSDTGIGIGKEHISKLFQIDTQYRRSGTDREKGSGLGLILCKELVEKSGGRIWVESETGKGTTFTFTLPKMPAE